MFTRGWACLRTPPLLGRNLPSLSPMIPALARPSRKFSHCYVLRDVRGEVGVSSMAFSSLTARHSFTIRRAQRLLSPLLPLHMKTSPVTPLFPLLTQKQGGTLPLKNVGAPTFSIFPLIFRAFSLPRRRVARILRRHQATRGLA